jgi:eukaryotic-like serine/threonine-protein kinase
MRRADLTASGAPPEGIPRPGELIAERYIVEAVLGTGGMGVVLRARHRALGHPVAIKLIRSGMAFDAAAFARFTREARALAGVSSDHVVRVLDFGVASNGSPFMVMEYLTGQDLKKELSLRGPLPLAEATDYVLEACEGLAIAHGGGIVHRDIKPANLFLEERTGGGTRIKVLDFGVSKLEEEEVLDLTKTAASLGSPLYMSPEQMRDAHRVDARTDIWSLGVVLYELVAGVRPFHGNDVRAVAAAVAADEPAPPRDLRPELPAAFEDALTRCLAKRPDARFDSVAALARALAPFASERGRLAAARIDAMHGDPPMASPEASSHAGARALPPPGDANTETVATAVVDTAPARTHGVSHKRAVRFGALISIGAATIAFVAFLGLDSTRRSSPPASPPSAASAPVEAVSAGAPPSPLSSSVSSVSSVSSARADAPPLPPPTATASTTAPAPPSTSKRAAGRPRPSPRHSAPNPALSAIPASTPRFGGTALDD